MKNDLNSDGVIKYAFKGEISKEKILEFYQNYTENNLSPLYKSEPIPSEPYDGNVKKIVSDNFEKEIIEYEHDSMVMFYLPWCEHCKDLEPIYTEIANEFAVNKGLIISKIDSSLNDVKGVTITSFPTILYYKKGEKSRPILFEKDDKSKENLTSFIQGIQ